MKSIKTQDIIAEALKKKICPCFWLFFGDDKIKIRASRRGRKCTRPCKDRDDVVDRLNAG